MQAIELEVDITANGRIDTCLPPSYRSWFGSHAKLIMILPETQMDELQRQQRLKKWRGLLAETHALPQTLAITDAEIAAEIEAYRNGL